jgi:hypothetical protein
LWPASSFRPWVGGRQVSGYCTGYCVTPLRTICSSFTWFSESIIMYMKAFVTQGIVKITQYFWGPGADSPCSMSWRIQSLWGPTYLTCTVKCSLWLLPRSPLIPMRLYAIIRVQILHPEIKWKTVFTILHL